MILNIRQGRSKNSQFSCSLAMIPCQSVRTSCDRRTGAYATTISAYGFIKLKNFLTETEVIELKDELNEEIKNAQNDFHKKQLEIQKKFLENDEVGDMELVMVEKAFATSPPKAETSYISLVVSLPVRAHTDFSGYSNTT